MLFTRKRWSWQRKHNTPLNLNLVELDKLTVRNNARMNTIAEATVYYELEHGYESTDNHLAKE